MVTQEGGNVRVCAIRGNFDDAQTGVKNVFAACKGKDLHGAVLSSANSINIGRLAPQVVYYFRPMPIWCRRGASGWGRRSTSWCLPATSEIFWQGISPSAWGCRWGGWCAPATPTMC